MNEESTSFPLLQHVPTVESWFAEQLEPLRARWSSSAISYAIGVYRRGAPPLRGESVVLRLAEARHCGLLERYLTLGDSILFLGTVFPEGVQRDSTELIFSIGAAAYDAVWRRTGRSWDVYRELGPRLGRFCRDAHTYLVKKDKVGNTWQHSFKL